MSIPISQMWAVTRYVLEQRRKGKRRYPLVLMLEPLYRCNLSCSGCGKIQYPPEVLRKNLSIQECLDAAQVCNVPVVSIAGGEPLLHPQIDQIVAGLVRQKRYVYLCTNAILLEQQLDKFRPSKYLSLSIHLDGLESEHDQSVCRPGVYRQAVAAIQESIRRGFRVTTNTTFFNDADPEKARKFFDAAMTLGVEGMMISPGYNYAQAPDQDRFLRRQQTIQLFRKILYNGRKSWIFNQSPLFLEFIAGEHDFECTPWGSPTYSVLGWQGPCYLLPKSYYPTFHQLMQETDWAAYGRQSGNPECADCMMHCGYEPTAVYHTFNSKVGFMTTVKAFFKAPHISAPAEI